MKIALALTAVLMLCTLGCADEQSGARQAPSTSPHPVALESHGSASATKPSPVSQSKSPTTTEDFAAMMKEFEAKRRRHSELAKTVEGLKLIPDRDLDSALRERIQSRLGETQDEGSELAKVRALPAGHRMLLATMILEDEVNNGGFQQFFWNSSHIYADEALVGYQLLGAKDYEKLMSAAIAMHASEAATMKSFRDQNTIEAFSESYKHSKLGTLDTEFYKLKDAAGSMRAAYIRARAADFVK